MKPQARCSRYLVIFATLICIDPGAGTSEGDIEVPLALGKGKLLHDKSYSSCHGLQLSGTDKGPSLVHPFYRPINHGDESYYRATLNGVRQHHWEFGDMQPVIGMTREKLVNVMPYVRFFQHQAYRIPGRFRCLWLESSFRCVHNFLFLAGKKKCRIDPVPV